MSAFLNMGIPMLAAGLRGYSLVMPWFVPMAVTLGALGTKTGFELRRLPTWTQRAQGWWGIILLSWLPAVIWILIQFVPQY